MVHPRWLYTTRASNERIEGGKNERRGRGRLSVGRESRKRRTINQNRTLCVVRYRWNRNKRGPRALVPILNVDISRHGQNWACYVIVDFSASREQRRLHVARESRAALYNISALLERPLGSETCTTHDASNDGFKIIRIVQCIHVYVFRCCVNYWLKPITWVDACIAICFSVCRLLNVYKG